MRTLIKLLIAALVIHGSWRAGLAYWDYYRFRDAVTETAQFSEKRSDQEVHARVMEIAAGLGLPVEPERVTVRREENHTFVDAAYTVQIEIAPRYRIPWEFKVSADAWTISSTAPQGGRPALR